MQMTSLFCIGRWVFCAALKAGRIQARRFRTRRHAPLCDGDAGVVMGENFIPFESLPGHIIGPVLAHTRSMAIALNGKGEGAVRESGGETGGTQPQRFPDLPSRQRLSADC